MSRYNPPIPRSNTFTLFGAVWHRPFWRGVKDAITQRRYRIYTMDQTYNELYDKGYNTGTTLYRALHSRRDWT